MIQAQSIESRGGRAEPLTISYRCALLNAITTVAFGLAAGVALTVLGMYLAPKILVLMGTPLSLIHI